MSTEAKSSYGSTLALLALAVLALYTGTRWLVVLIPAAVLVWYFAATATLGSSRN